MRAFPFAVSLVALGVAGFAIVIAMGLSRELSDRAATDAANESRLTKLELALAPREAGPSAPRPLAPVPATGAAARGESAGTTSAMGSSSATDAPLLAAGGRPAATAPMDFEHRLAEVEKRLHERDATMGQTMDMSNSFAGPTMINSVDDATKHLDLSPSQRADFERTIEDAKRDIDVIRKTQDETGMTWEKAEKETVSYQNGGLSIDGSKLAAFREKVMPGRSESFGGAMRRVRETAFDRMRSSLSSDQQEKFKKSATDGLLPGAGDPFGLFSFAVSGATPIDAQSDPIPAMDAK
jgi:hypothetical protein